MNPLNPCCDLSSSSAFPLSPRTMILSANQVSGKSFDYIIVGGGTCGLVLATRLSEDPSVSVLVIEAGAANLDDPEILDPTQFSTRFGNPKYDWAFETVPQKSCNDLSVPFNRGKGLGGSSGINFFQYHRPAKSDIDAFEELGNEGWNWALLEDYYVKSERFVEPVKKDPAVLSYTLANHGATGPLTVGLPNVVSRFEGPYRTAIESLGIEFAEKPTNGFWFTPISVDPVERVRSYAANKYYQPNATRENLSVVVSAHVTKIVTALDANGQATAVEVAFLSEDTSYTVKVGKEVVLSAGYILELSGIGNKSILEAAGIETKIHLPGVGENVQEHFYSSVLQGIRPEVMLNLYEALGKDVFGMAATCIAFVPLASVSPMHASLQESLAKAIEKDISTGKISESLRKQYTIQLKHLQDREPSCEFLMWPLFRTDPSAPVPGVQFLSVSAMANHPFSRGSIHITSNDPLLAPRIDPNYFEYEYDLLSIVEQLKFCRKILDQEPLKQFLTGNEFRPGPNVQSDEEIADYVKANMRTTWHTIGSCSMLPRADGGVVDRNLKVYNTTNIRVVDMSILPLHIGAHIQATAYAVGELAADIITGQVF
ncbi:alcohol oxidase [Favolaschia claudopus]|uniref:Alcohol oxidase n=1 Tax=Favolaschia claudopus TaxID=2862362 RepID=A0AAW0BZR9_9AGAR